MKIYAGARRGGFLLEMMGVGGGRGCEEPIYHSKTLSSLTGGYWQGTKQARVNESKVIQFVDNCHQVTFSRAHHISTSR